MPRVKPAITKPIKIDPDAIYTPQAAQLTLDLTPKCLAREIRMGRLRVAKRTGRHWFKGCWLLEWLWSGERTIMISRHNADRGMEAA